MQCKILEGKLVFENDTTTYTLDMCQLPNEADPQKQGEMLVLECMKVREIRNKKASGSGWANSVLIQLNARESQLEHKFMDLAISRIVLKG